jgi:isocitrate lyase
VIARTDAEAADLLTRRRQRQAFLTGERTVEGFFKTHPGIDQAISRGLAYAEYADMVWCETGKPDLAFAKTFAEAIHAKFPGKLLAYNCSPSFNWKKNLDDATIAKFQRELGAMGYKFQFITLAGFHALNYSMFNWPTAMPATRCRPSWSCRKPNCRRLQGLHCGQAPARSRHRLLRRRDPGDPARPVVHHRPGSTEDEQFFDDKAKKAADPRVQRFE